MFSRFAGAGKYTANGEKKRNTFEGVVTFPGGRFDELRVDGVCVAEGAIDADTLDVNGVFTAKSDVRADELDCDGVIAIEGNLRVKKANIDGVITVHGDKVEADYIRCDGVLSAKGQVSADIIEADGFINATEIVGDKITIKSFRKSAFFKLFMKIREAFTDSDFSKIDLIEATTIELRGVRAKTVSGQDVTIGPLCVIGRVDCSGELRIDAEATVKEIVGAAKNEG